MGVGDAEDYYNSAIYGDPVDGDEHRRPDDRGGLLYDWIYSYADWQKLSAL